MTEMTQQRPALVGNAASEKQVKSAKQREQDRLDNENADVRAILAMPGGRRFIWRLLTACKTYASVYEGNAKIHYNSGQQDVGHMIVDWITQADVDAFLMMMKENKEISQ